MKRDRSFEGVFSVTTLTGELHENYIHFWQPNLFVVEFFCKYVCSYVLYVLFSVLIFNVLSW